MEKTHKKKRRLIDIMNPENLQKRISAYGYDFSLSNYLVSALISVIVAVAFGMLFALKPGYIAVIVLICIGLLPNVILNGYRNMYEHKRFADVSDYMEQILYSFKLNNKIVSALQDTQTMFTGQMYTAIQEALDYLDAGVSKTDLRREALQKIEAYYPLEQVRAIHAYMCTVERNGGNADSSVDLLLKDKNIWADNILLLQEEKKKSKMHISGAIFCTMAFAAVFHWVYRSMPEQYSILNHPITQIVTTLFIIADIFIWYKANKEVAKSWIEREADKKAERAVSYLKMIRAWDEKAERKKSFIIAVPFSWQPFHYLY